jgi:hypothetical protein
MAGVTDPKTLAMAGAAAVAPVILRWLNPKDASFGVSKEWRNRTFSLFTLQALASLERLAVSSSITYWLKLSDLIRVSMKSFWSFSSDNFNYGTKESHRSRYLLTAWRVGY